VALSGINLNWFSNLRGLVMAIHEAQTIVNQISPYRQSQTVARQPTFHNLIPYTQEPRA
jgi:hypothetical protein